MKLFIKCTHPDLEENIECKLIDSDYGYIFQCPVCKREIILELTDW